jgi:hypothetical protein
VPTDFELICFEDEMVKVRGLPEAGRWKLGRDESVPLGLTVELHSIKAPTDLYLARFRWANYFQAPSLKFLHRQSGADNDPSAWPLCTGFRPTSLDACVAWTMEGHAVHPDWAGSPRAAFVPPEAPMQSALLNLQHVLDTTYTGRWSP